jgi:beta-glucanase (GH16 family)
MNFIKFSIFWVLTIFLSNGCNTRFLVNKYPPTWEDDFTQSKTLDETSWSKIPRGKYEWNKYMTDDERCYAIREGKLILRGIENTNPDIDTAHYLTGGIYSKDKRYFGFGRWEIRAKLNGAQGAWPAIWLLPQDGKWPDDGEIDIMEHLNFDSIAYQTVHSHYTHILNELEHPKQGTTAVIDSEDFNTYAVEIYTDSLVFFVNYQKTFSYPRIETDKDGQYPFDKHQYYLLIDMQLGGPWAGDIHPHDLPVEMEIDWVRFYSFKDNEVKLRK